MAVVVPGEEVAGAGESDIVMVFEWWLVKGILEGIVGFDMKELDGADAADGVVAPTVVGAVEDFIALDGFEEQGFVSGGAFEYGAAGLLVPVVPRVVGVVTVRQEGIGPVVAALVGWGGAQCSAAAGLPGEVGLNGQGATDECGQAGKKSAAGNDAALVWSKHDEPKHGLSGMDIK